MKMIFKTPLGKILALASEKGICLLEFVDDGGGDSEESVVFEGSEHLDEIEEVLVYENSEENKKTKIYLETLKIELEEYFSGERRDFSVPVVLEGTDFQKAAWKQLQKIPYGKTVSYGQQAEAIGKSRAVRAIGAANGKNKILIIVPCHRVIGANGKLTGYAGEVWRKEKLLDLESGKIFSLY